MAASVKNLFCIIFIIFGSVASYDWPSLEDLGTVWSPSNIKNDTIEGGKSRIVGGQPADIKDHPYQVSFIVNGTYFCGGFIVSENYIITAAHCAQNVTPSTVVLRVGSSCRTNGTVVPIAEVTPHPMYNITSFDKDVAVMKTVNPIEFSDVVKAIKLPPKGRPMVADTKAQVSGFGKTQFGAPTIPTCLMTVEIPVVNHKYCEYVYPSMVTENEWCGGNLLSGGKGPCQGDSGGAAVQDGLAVGIVSYSRFCAYPLSPSVFADVAAPAIRDFITEQTGL